MTFGSKGSFSLDWASSKRILTPLAEGKLELGLFINLYIKCGDIFQAFLISQSLFHRVLVKTLHAKIMENVCLCTRKTVMCASAAMGSLELTVRKVR